MLNKYSMESESNTPDFVLATFLCEAMKAFNKACIERNDWFGDDGERVTIK